MGVPPRTISSSAVRKGHRGAAHALLVLFYFLHSIANATDVAADFELPVPDALAAFLQSPAAVESLVRGGAIAASSGKGNPQDKPQAKAKAKVKAKVKAKAATIAPRARRSAPAPSPIKRVASPVVAARPPTSQRQSSRRQAEAPASAGTSMPTPAPASVPAPAPAASPAPPAAQDVVWRNTEHKVKGELVVKKMRFAIDSLQRQLAAVVAEKDALAARFTDQVSELKRRYENELLLQRAALNNEVAVCKLADVSRDMASSASHEALLHALASKLADESTRYGGTCDAVALASEVVVLRQALAASEEARNQAAVNNRELQAALETAHALVAQESENALAIHLDYARQDASIVVEVDALVADTDAAGDAPARGLTARERALVARIRELEFSAAQSAAQAARSTEELKAQLLEAKAAGVAEEAFGKNLTELEAELVAEHETVALREQVAALRKANAFLRGAADAACPSDTLDDPEQSERRNGALLSALQDLTRVFPADDPVAQEVSSVLFSHFWALVCEARLASRRAARTATNCATARARVGELESQLGEVQSSFARELATALEAARAEANADHAAAAAERSQLAAQLQVALASLEQAKAEAEALQSEAASARASALADDAARFSALHAKFTKLRAEAKRLQLREQVWKELCDQLQSMTQELSGSSSLDATKARELASLEAGVVAAIEQLNKLARPADAAGATDHLETDVAIDSALALARAQIEQLTETLAAVRSQVHELQAAQASSEANEAAAVAAAGDAATKIALLNAQLADLTAANEALATRAAEADESARATTAHLQAQVADLTSALADERSLWTSTTDRPPLPEEGAPATDAEPGASAVDAIVARLRALLPAPPAASRPDPQPASAFPPILE
ncbi:uncharacterized protein AMSG_01626 [Thecamonas trahens ATCC 50062]|uniref:Uncharacterized protein n=1 Tax=Thecamonas trahens ATCC 50062 TaxID=461836 RepID=A0A0L0DR37_THETB|nr:hypothetical protein AMSG_01626 [Thecamonas trahens ATCC 50062]KNC54774.1 hypothetical protein AMSG_01626 [Thecamonas trahens ATCC 50062]|eukprot:XP_013761674.1 hypothetical protein AMSG_01626 [Thecamonas trahens ATCC 50062]